MKISSFRWQPVILSLLIGGTLAVLGWSIIWHFGNQDPFMPHAHCFLLKRDLIRLHGISDFFIGVSYVAISGTLTYLVVRARREIPFHWMMLAFATFIVACGATHFMEVYTLQSPNPPYWLAGDLKLLTALASVATAFLLPPLVPNILRLLEEARLSGERGRALERTHLQLEEAHSTLEKTHSALAEAHEKVKQLDQLKTSFFANVSHDLRTPLTLVFGPIDRMLESGHLKDAERRDLEIVRRNAVLLHKHVNDLLDLSKLEAGKMQVRYTRVDLGRMVRMVADYFSSSGGCSQELRVEAPESLPAELDAEKIQRVLFNLISNACKFTPQGGLVRVTLRIDADEKVSITVEDSGPGVPEGTRSAVFERFFQNKETTARGGAGTGLGLSIVKEFVELHGGIVDIGDSPAGGAAFRVQLPRHAPPEVPIAPEAEPESSVKLYGKPPGREVAWALLPISPAAATTPDSAPNDDRPRIIVAEDNAEMREHIAQTLGGEYQVLTAPDGRAALALAEEHAPDLIVTDLMMPEMSGDELLIALQRHPRLNTVPVILLTARADEEMKLNLLGSGARDYVVKPFALDELRARVRNQISAKQVRDTLQGELKSQEQDVARLAKEVTLRARELERAKAAAESANRAKDHFLAVLSHELRTPLTPALVIVTSLHEHVPDDPAELRENLAVVRRNIELEARLIDDLLDLTRIERGKLRLNLAPVDAHEAIRNAVEMCRSEMLKKGETVELELNAERCHLRGDSTRLLQVVWNLLLNAVKFTPAGGRITIRTFNRGDDRLIIQVIDTGIGIAPEGFAKIFEPFEQGERPATQQAGGLGLGLAVAKGLVDAHGGAISVESAGVGHGATFTVELPAIEKPALMPDAPKKAASSPPASAMKLRILLVEDHEDSRRALERMLARWGYDVTCAGSVREALENAAANSFDVLLSDIGLPDGLGTEVMAKVRELRPETLGIAMSGFGMEEDQRRTREAGFTEHLVKPVGSPQLKTALDEVVAHLEKRNDPS